MVPAVAQPVQRLKAMAYASRSGKAARRTWTPLRFEADEAGFDINLHDG
jgi:hypothetical protein